MEQHISKLMYNEKERECQELQYTNDKPRSELEDTDAELKKALEEVAMWQDRYEKLKKSMLGAVTSIE